MPLLTEEDIKIREKYLKPPDAKQIKDFITELEVNYSQFERFYDIPKGTIRHVINLRRELPVKFWPIVYEKKVPTYGLKYTKVLTKLKPFAQSTKSSTKKSQSDNIKRLTDL